jgi:hypothetical protein
VTNIADALDAIDNQTAPNIPAGGTMEAIG